MVLKTGHGNRWTRERVTALRSSYRIPVYCEVRRQTALNPGSILARLPPSSVLRHAPCYLLLNGVKSTRRIPWRMAPGSSALLVSTAQPPMTSPCGPRPTQGTPRYRTLPNKISSPQ